MPSGWNYPLDRSCCYRATLHHLTVKPPWHHLADYTGLNPVIMLHSLASWRNHWQISVMWPRHALTVFSPHKQLRQIPWKQLCKLMDVCIIQSWHCSWCYIYRFHWRIGVNGSNVRPYPPRWVCPGSDHASLHCICCCIYCSHGKFGVNGSNVWSHPPRCVWLDVYLDSVYWWKSWLWRETPEEIIDLSNGFGFIVEYSYFFAEFFDGLVINTFNRLN